MRYIAIPIADVQQDEIDTIVKELSSYEEFSKFDMHNNVLCFNSKLDYDRTSWYFQQILTNIAPITASKFTLLEFVKHV